MNPFLPLPSSVDTGLDGFRLWPGLLPKALQQDLLASLRDAVAKAPLYRPVTPGGQSFSVRMTNMGHFGWVSDRSGYRYQSAHPVTGHPWPPIPQVLLDLWRATTTYPQLPDACLVNFYDRDARMGLHQDRDEKDFEAPVLSVSLGDTATFRYGAREGGPTRSVRLASGDVCILSGPARLSRHGVDRILGGTSTLLPHGGRINLTLRVSQ